MGSGEWRSREAITNDGSVSLRIEGRASESTVATLAVYELVS